MADPLSIAAAGAGFLSLAGQVADGLIKLRAFYKAIRCAPQEVQSLCDEMNIVRSLLEDAGKRVRNISLPYSDHTQPSNLLAQCEKTRSHLEHALKKLSTGFEQSKLAAFRFPFKKKEIEELLPSLERGKVSLLLVNQSIEA
jgi:hypothetical protein